MTTRAENSGQSRPDGTKDYRPLGSGELADPWDLGEFFEALGPVLRFPPKGTESPAAGSWVPRGTSRRRATILALAATALVAGAAGAPVLMQAMRSSLPPPGLHGRWTTPAERYAGRSFEVSETSLRLGVGGHEATYPIADVRRRDSSSAAIYTIQYRDGESALEFAIAIGPDSVAQIRNLPSVEWRRVQR